MILLFFAFSLNCTGFSFSAAAGELKQKATFASAEIAFKALAEAYRNNDENLLISMFGVENQDLVIIADKTAAREDRLNFSYYYDQYADVIYEEEDKAVLILGPLGWPFPIPVIKENNHWQFDAEQGKEEILNRRIGRNELAAIAICNAYVAGQQLYGAKDLDGDHVFEYAQKTVSTPGKKDGLYWKPKGNEEVSPLGPLVSQQSAYFKDKETSEPIWGYYFRILTRQGDNVPGGKYDYIINNNMIAGFALVAYPAEYGNSGIMTFQVNHQGRVFEKDMGKDTAKIAGEMTEYNPDETWTLVTPQDSAGN